MRSTSSQDITGEYEAEIMRDYIEWIDYIHKKWTKQKTLGIVLWSCEMSCAMSCETLLTIQ